MYAVKKETLGTLCQKSRSFYVKGYNHDATQGQGMLIAPFNYSLLFFLP